MVDDRRCPVFVVTGFLGSGKTTLLREVLASPAFRDTAVIVNELGDVGLDHVLLREARDEVVLLEGGCICCTVRDDLARTLLELWTGAARRTLPRFRRVVLETTGLADPTPLLATLAAPGLLRQSFRVAATIATVDALLGADTLERHEESRKQVALADRLVLTKTDLATEAERARTLEALRSVAPFTPLVVASRGSVDPAFLLADAEAAVAGLAEDADSSPRPGTSHGHDPSCAGCDDPEHAHPAHGDAPHRHGAGLVTFVVDRERPLRYEAFALFLSMTTRALGDRLLRVKGYIRVVDEEKPLLVQAVQHVVSPVVALDAYPDGIPRSRLVFLARDLPDERVAEIRAAIEGLAGAQS
ncbi:MAG: GTP-binding protein [Polyangiales bacterium]